MCVGGTSVANSIGFIVLHVLLFKGITKTRSQVQLIDYTQNVYSMPENTHTNGFACTVCTHTDTRMPTFPRRHTNTQTHKLTHTDTHIHMHTHDVICVAREQTTNYFTICVYYVKKHFKKIN